MKNVGLLVATIAVLFAFSTASAITWYVHPDSTLNSIQDGIDLCSTGDTVLVGAGTYVENINFNGMAIAVMSEYGADTTTIDGSSPAHDDTGSVVLFMSGEDANSVLQGFTITGGTGTLDPVEGRMGGGILCINNSSPTITNNTISGNSAQFGGGIDCVFNCSPSIDSNIITANNVNGSGGGIDLYLNSSPIITNNSINGNNAQGSAGGIQCFTNCAPLIMNNEIKYNLSMGYGGAVRVADNSSPVIRDNDIEGNEAFDGGGIVCAGAGSSPQIVHNTITENVATYGGGIKCEYNATPTIDSCLISYNVGDEIYCQIGGNPIIYYNDIIDSNDYGVFNADPNVLVVAEYNWWGDSTGPYHTTNPSGQGVAVSDDVDFDPWLTNPGIEEIGPEIRVHVVLQVTPNPFRNITSIRYTITDPGYTMQNPTLRIYDALGRLVRQWDYQTMGLSDYIKWNGTDRFDQPLPSGIYFVSIIAADATTTRKVLLVR